MHREGHVEATEKKKPDIVAYYNSTKGGVDTFDQMANIFSCKRKKKRWPLVVFMNMIDLAAIVAYIAWTTKNSTKSGRGK